MTLSHEDFQRYNTLGFIPGPQETEEAFLERVHYCENLKSQFTEQLGQQIPVELSSMPSELQKTVNEKTRKLYDIVLDWVPIVFSNYKMFPWHGGCAWIFQMSADTPTAAFFQLRKSLAKKSTYMGIYDREELIVHETAHVGRMLFREPKFEEILAYRSSKSAFRSFFGPIIQAPWETLLLLILLFLSFLGELFLDGSMSQWFKIATLGLIILGIVRVCLRQWQFSRCYAVLKTLLKSSEKADAVIYRLVDREIIAFGKMTSEELRSYINKEDSLRWQMIYKVYFT